MKNTMIFILLLILTSISFSQKNYFVAKDGTGNFSTITQVNSAALNFGDVISFKGGERFSDAVLMCRAGVTYNSFGNGQAIIGDSLGMTSNDYTIFVDAQNVTIDNLKIYGYQYTWGVITFSKSYLTITNCEIIGGKWAHYTGRHGIYQSDHSANAGHNLKFQRNVIHGFSGSAIYISRPYNVDIGYNEMYNLWREGAIINAGASGINRATFGDGNNPEDVWDCNYTFNIHHNNIHHFEYVAIGAGYSRMIIEYNEIHNNLDERIYRGGAKHGSVGKIYDNYGTTAGSSLGSLGVVFRYNYIHHLKRFGQKGYIYGVPSQSNRDSGIPVTVSTNSGNDWTVYLDAGSPAASGGDYDGNGIMDYDGAPDMVVSGLGYGNTWIHNNIFYNCSNQIFGRSFNYQGEFYPNLPTYFINNTILDCGQSYVTEGNGLMISQANSQSPHVVANNIIDYTLSSARYAGKWRDSPKFKIEMKV